VSACWISRNIWLDPHALVLCTVNQINNLWQALGQPELADDERFATNEARMENRDALTAIIEQWMSGFRT